MSDQRCLAALCRNVATHTVELPTPGGALRVGYCDEHTRTAIANGAKHIEWLDKPKIAGEQ